MLQLDRPFLFILVSFVVFMTLMRGLFFEPIAEIKLRRAQLLEADRLAREKALADEAEKRAQYDRKLADARKRSQQLITERTLAAKQQAVESIAKTRASLQKDLERQFQELDDWRDETYKELAQQRETLVQTILATLHLSHEGVLS